MWKENSIKLMNAILDRSFAITDLGRLDLSDGMFAFVEPSEMYRKFSVIDSYIRTLRENSCGIDPVDEFEYELIKRLIHDLDFTAKRAWLNFHAFHNAVHIATKVYMCFVNDNPDINFETNMTARETIYTAYSLAYRAGRQLNLDPLVVIWP